MKLEYEEDFLSTQYIDDIHCYCSLEELYPVNINPVILDSVLFDIEKKPNLVVKGRGCPQKRRLRYRSRYATEEESNIVCR